MKYVLAFLATVASLAILSDAGALDTLRNYADSASARIDEGVQQVSSRLQAAAESARLQVEALSPVDSDDPAALRRSLNELTEGYNALCQEIYHLSRHVIFHEHTLRHIALSSHHKQGHGEDNDAHSHNHGTGHDHAGHPHGNHTADIHAAESSDEHHHEHHEHAHGESHDHAEVANSTSEDHHHHNHNGHEHHHHDHHDQMRRKRQLAVPTLVTGGDHEQAADPHHHEGDHAHEGTGNNDHHAEESHDHAGHHNDHSDEDHGCSNENAKWRCSLLHQHACHLGHHGENSNLTFAEQYQVWFKSLISHRHGTLGNISPEGAGVHHHGFHHHHEEAHNHTSGHQHDYHHEHHTHENEVDGATVAPHAHGDGHHAHETHGHAASDPSTHDHHVSAAN